MREIASPRLSAAVQASPVGLLVRRWLAMTDQAASEHATPCAMPMSYVSRPGDLASYTPLMHVITVSQATSYLRELLESDLVLGDVWISGEVSGPRTQPSGHTYFVLKDANSQLRAVMFRSALLRQRRMVDYLEHGAQVMVH